MTSNWNPEMSKAATAEGWDIFFIDGDDTKPELQFLQDEESPFQTDGQVIQHVKRRAAEGSALHQAALELEQSWNHGLITNDDEDIEDDDDDDEYEFYEEDEIHFADPGGNSALRASSKSNPRNLPCPNCGTENVLTPADVALHYQCDRCADRAERGGDY